MSKRAQPSRPVAITYLRVSTVDQAEDGVSLAAQREKVEAYCLLNELALVEVFEDAGISGKATDNRPGLQTALAAVASGPATHLVCHSLSLASPAAWATWPGS